MNKTPEERIKHKIEQYEIGINGAVQSVIYELKEYDNSEKGRSFYLIKARDLLSSTIRSKSIITGLEQALELIKEETHD